MNIEIFGGGERTRYTARLLSKAELANEKSIEVSRVRVFPIPTSRDSVHITGCDEKLTELLKDGAGSVFNVGYGFPKDALRQMEDAGEKYYDAAKDELFLKENAYISALGALCYVLCTSKKVPRDISFGVVGYGRIGSELVRMLLFFGASVHIFTSKQLTRIDLGEIGIKTSEIRVSGFEFDDLTGIDILFNTAPCDLSHIFKGEELREGLRVIDLASGDSFKGVGGVEYLPSIPERMYPESAGAVYAKRAISAMKGEV